MVSTRQQQKNCEGSSNPPPTPPPPPPQPAGPSLTSCNIPLPPPLPTYVLPAPHKAATTRRKPKPRQLPPRPIMLEFDSSSDASQFIRLFERIAQTEDWRTNSLRDHVAGHLRGAPLVWYTR
uniref:Uncharacterized protein n=1 Tax=Lygus hesperus TaxID=30085 RepID=A0A0A9WTE3_LYGHE